MTKEDIVEQAAPKKLVISLMRRLNETKTRVQSINGEIGQEIKDAIEDKHLHSAALKTVARLVRMDPVKREDFMRSYCLYFDYATEAKMFGSAHVGDLVDNAEEASETKPPANFSADNIRKLQRGIKQKEDENQSLVG